MNYPVKLEFFVSTFLLVIYVFLHFKDMYVCMFVPGIQAV